MGGKDLILPRSLKFPNQELTLDRTLVMGVLNVTPDSFSDGGQFADLDTALAQARAMLEAGVDIIDIGGESTRPGASAVAVQQELDRVIPAIESVVAECDVAVSIDTSKPAVMSAALKAGAVMINDVNALQAEGAIEIVVEANVPVCLMHMMGEPRSMQHEPHYENVVNEVYAYLEDRVQVCIKAGLAKEKLIIDPGIGFGKTLAHNLSLLRQLQRFTGLANAVLIGVSRKSMIGAITGAPIDKRLPGSVAAAVFAALNGADIVRVHDVAETVQALQVIDRLSRK